VSQIVYPKRLIEDDLPIKGISAHAREEKSSRHGQISTLEWQPIVKVEHYRLKQDSVKHPVELKEDAPPYRTNAG
jgi:hypothetical protein